MPYTHRFVWPAAPDTRSVVVTGDFDDWLLTRAVLEKENDTGDFAGTLYLDKPRRLVFKFVVNGTQWITSPKYKIEHDVHGNANNYLDPEDLVEVADNESQLADTSGPADTRVVDIEKADEPKAGDVRAEVVEKPMGNSEAVDKDVKKTSNDKEASIDVASAQEDRMPKLESSGNAAEEVEAKRAAKDEKGAPVISEFAKKELARATNPVDEQAKEQAEENSSEVIAEDVSEPTEVEKPSHNEPELPNKESKVQQEEIEGLDKVSTSQSSYAALSIPSDGYEDVGIAVDEDGYARTFPADDDENARKTVESGASKVDRNPSGVGTESSSEPRHRTAPHDISAFGKAHAQSEPRPIQSHYTSTFKGGDTNSGDTTPTNSLKNHGIYGAKQPTSSTQQESEVSTLGSHSRSSSYTARPPQGGQDQASLVVSDTKMVSDTPEHLRTERKRKGGLVTRIVGLFQ